MFSFRPYRDGHHLPLIAHVSLGKSLTPYMRRMSSLRLLGKSSTPVPRGGHGAGGRVASPRGKCARGTPYDLLPTLVPVHLP